MSSLVRTAALMLALVGATSPSYAQGDASPPPPSSSAPESAAIPTSSESPPAAIAAPLEAPATPQAPDPTPKTPGEPNPPNENDPFLSSVGPGRGPGIPWQAVLLVQLLAYMATDTLPYI